MAAETILIWLFIGAVAGWLSGLVVKGGGFGLLGGYRDWNHRRVHWRLALAPTWRRSRRGLTSSDSERDGRRRRVVVDFAPDQAGLNNMDAQSLSDWTRR